MNPPRTVVITGGTRGLGRAAAEAFAAQGDHVWSLSRTPPRRRRDHGPVRHLVADVQQRPQLDAAVAAIQREAESIDVWINNAGMGAQAAFADVDNALWERVFSANFRGTVHATRAALPAMTSPGGAIINIASLAGLMSPRGHSAYATAKAAVIALTRANAVELAGRGIRVNAIAPGPVDTDAFRAAGGDPDARARSIPTRAMVQPREIARACLFLAEDLPSLTGHTLVIDGGCTAAGCYVA